ncbi:MAG: glycogen/starch synthase [Lentisphaeria bacterium]|nr:glycogen/starch synthase [Candidatus Neomarinimicrobiota bacterium]MCF7842109.1 glycogen/starch synthase [Lentisphaeria bacterium]
MPRRIYFLTTEIDPFAQTYQLAPFSNQIPAIFNEKKQDIRIISPRYGFISERRYIIREVIRLREIEVDYKDEMLIGAAKSAFVPNTKVQVYFLDYLPYFGSTTKSLYTVRGGRFNQRNAEKFFYFGKSAIENLTYLYWQPEYLFLNDWTSAIVAILMKTVYKDEEFFAGMKTVLNLINPVEMGPVEEKHFRMAGIDPEITEGFENNLLGLAAKYADEITAISFPDSDAKEKIKQNQQLSQALEQEQKPVKHFSLSDDTEEGWRALSAQFEEYFNIEV